MAAPEVARPARWAWIATVALLLATLAGAGAFLRARSYDLWWQVETGEQIVKSLSIPRMDDYSFTSRGARWVNHSWLSQVLLHWFHSTLGPLGLWLFKALCAAGIAAAGYRALTRSGAPSGLALILVAASQVGLRSRLGERPETVSLLMAACVAALLLGLVSGRRRGASLLLLGALTFLWANLHAASLIVPALTAALLAGAALEKRRGGHGGRVVAAAALAVIISAGCLLLNPFGSGIFLVPLEIDRALDQGNLLNPEWGRPPLDRFPYFYAWVAAAAAITLVSLRRRRPASAARAGMLALAALMALTSVRHIGIFFALLPVCLDAGAISWPRVLERRAAGAIACLAAASWMALVPAGGGATGIGIEPDRFPVESADFIEENLPGGRLYNDVAFGGYLIWRFYPERRVFIDGRNEVHAMLLGEISAALDDGRLWESLLDRHGIDGAVVRYRPGAVTVLDAATGALSTSTFSETHFPRSHWALVHWDDVAMVFVRRDGPSARIAGELEYLHVRPEAWMQTIPTMDEGADPDTIAELERTLRDDPDCRLARSLLSRLRPR